MKDVRCRSAGHSSEGVHEEDDGADGRGVAKGLACEDIMTADVD